MASNSNLMTSSSSSSSAASASATASAVATSSATVMSTITEENWNVILVELQQNSGNRILSIINQSETYLKTNKFNFTHFIAWAIRNKNSTVLNRLLPFYSSVLVWEKYFKKIFNASVLRYAIQHKAFDTLISLLEKGAPLNDENDQNLFFEVNAFLMENDNTKFREYLASILMKGVKTYIPSLDLIRMIQAYAPRRMPYRDIPRFDNTLFTRLQNVISLKPYTTTDHQMTAMEQGGDFSAVYEDSRVHLRIFPANNHYAIKSLEFETSILASSFNSVFVNAKGICITPSIAAIFPLLEGDSLAAIVAARSRFNFPTSSVLRSAHNLATALFTWHSFDIPYRLLCSSHIFAEPNKLKLNIINADRYSLSKSAILPMQYRAPEIIRDIDAQQGSIEADIYALGCVMLLLAFGHEPWKDLSINEITQNLVTTDPLTHATKIKHQYDFPEKISSQFLEILKGCFHKEPSDRLPLRSIIEKLQRLIKINEETVQMPTMNWFHFSDTNFGNLSAEAGFLRNRITVNSAHADPNYINPNEPIVHYLKTLETMGTILPSMSKMNEQDLEIAAVLRPNGNVVLASVSFSISKNIFDRKVAVETASATAANAHLELPVELPLEVVCEIHRDDLPPHSEKDLLEQIQTHPLFGCFLSAIEQIKIHGFKVLEALREHSHAKLIVRGKDVPAEFLDNNGIAQFLLGVPSNTIPTSYHNGRESVPIFSLRLVNNPERVLACAWELGMKPMVSRFIHEKSYHIARMFSEDHTKFYGHTKSFKYSDIPVPAGVLIWEQSLHPVGIILARVTSNLQSHLQTSSISSTFSIDSAITAVLSASPASSVASVSSAPINSHSISQFIKIMQIQYQLYLYKEFADYLVDPNLYAKYQVINKARDMDLTPQNMPMHVPLTRYPSEFATKIYRLQEDCYFLVREFIQKINQIYLKLSSMIKDFSADTIDLQVIIKNLEKDETWLIEASRFCIHQTLTVARIFNDPVLKRHYANFLALAPENIPWPHRDTFLTELNRLGFVFDPTMNEPDRCRKVLNNDPSRDDVTVSHFRSWHLAAFQRYKNSFAAANQFDGQVVKDAGQVVKNDGQTASSSNCIAKK